MAKQNKSITRTINNTTNKRKRNEQAISECIFTVDILIEILSRLPVSSLSRFKLVCKVWYSLISSDPHFAELHFSRGYVSSSTSPSVISLCNEYKKRYITLMDADAVRRHLVLETMVRNCSISPACNGFICIYSRTSTYLAIFNPTTMQKVVVRNASKTRYSNSKCSLGYVPTTKEYKIVWLYYQEYNLENQLLPVQCQVLTLGASSWRKVDTTFNGISAKGLTINGVMYWIVNWLSSESESFEGDIVSFRLQDEVFERIQFSRDIPNETPWPSCQLLGILELEGRLCVTVSHRFHGMEMWMLEDNVNHAWIIKYRWCSGAGIPILINEGKFWLSEGEDRVRCCDIETGAGIWNTFPYKRMILDEAHAHNESLLSIPVIM